MEKLEQGQIWKVGEELYRIVTWQRLSIEYKHFSDWENREGSLHKVTKKEFCRLIRGGSLFEGVDSEQDLDGDQDE